MANEVKPCPCDIGDRMDYGGPGHEVQIEHFCWGGVVTHYLALECPEVKAGVPVDGVGGKRVDRYELKSPTLFIFGEKARFIPLEQVSVLGEKLKEKCTVDYQVKIFPGQTHGFVHRKREDINPADKPSIQEARADILNWLNKYM